MSDRTKPNDIISERDIERELYDPEHEQRMRQASIDQFAEWGRRLAKRQEEAFLSAILGVEAK